MPPHYVKSSPEPVDRVICSDFYEGFINEKESRLQSLSSPESNGNTALSSFNCTKLKRRRGKEESRKQMKNLANTFFTALHWYPFCMENSFYVCKKLQKWGKWIYIIFSLLLSIVHHRHPHPTPSIWSQNTGHLQLCICCHNAQMKMNVDVGHRDPLPIFKQSSN